MSNAANTLFGKDFDFILQLIHDFEEKHDPSYEDLLKENLKLRARMSWVDAKAKELIAGFNVSKGE